MAKKPTITTIASGYYSRQALNTNFENLRDSFDNTLSLDGSTPNSMGADLDMNGNDILNAGTIAVADLTVAGLDVNTALNASVSASAASAVASDVSAVASAASASSAALYEGPWIDDVATLLADTTLTLTPGQPNTVVIGDYVRTRKEGFSYEVVASGGHVTTAGGVNLYVLGSEIYPEQIAPNTTPLTTDMTDAITKADARARVLDVPVVLSGSYRSTSTITFTAETVVANRAKIIKDVDNTEVVRFQGAVGGATGQFRNMRGTLTAEQSAQPADGQTLAHGFVFEDVIHATFDALIANNVAYAFVNDETSAHGLCWGNVWQKWQARGCVQGYVNWAYSGSGGHTENTVSNAYFSGFNIGAGPTYLPKLDTPIILNNAEGFNFTTLNMEWTEVSGGGNWINVQNGTTLRIGSFHPEGLKKTDTGSHKIFNLSNGGTIRTNVQIGNIHLNGIEQLNNGSKIALMGASTTTKGRMSVESFSGTAASNDVYDLVLLNTSSSASFHAGANSGWEEFFTDVRVGTLPADFTPTVFFGGKPYENFNLISNPGAVIDIGKASYMRLSGTATAATTTITSASYAGDRMRDLTLDVQAASFSLGSGGNINKPSSSGAFPVTIANNRMVDIKLNTVTNKANVIGYSN